ncbi:unnamed protein product, partial [Ectocarpus sp. 13 AM-2016]
HRSRLLPKEATGGRPNQRPRSRCWVPLAPSLAPAASLAQPPSRRGRNQTHSPSLSPPPHLDGTCSACSRPPRPPRRLREAAAAPWTSNSRGMVAAVLPSAALLAVSPF